MAFSGGFHPHPRISYANAAATGTASEAEYVEISVTARVDPDALRLALDAALPDGLDVLAVVEAGPGALADRLQASEWVIALRGMPVGQLREAADAFWAQTQVEVTRVLKAGPRTFDARAAVLDLAVDTAASAPVMTGVVPGECAILRLVVRHTTPAVRPDDVLTALRVVAGLEPPTPPLVIRLAQGPLQEGSVRVADPLAADKSGAGD